MRMNIKVYFTHKNRVYINDVSERCYFRISPDEVQPRLSSFMPSKSQCTYDFIPLIDKLREILLNNKGQRFFINKYIYMYIWETSPFTLWFYAVYVMTYQLFLILFIVLQIRRRPHKWVASGFSHVHHTFQRGWNFRPSLHICFILPSQRYVCK